MHKCNYHCRSCDRHFASLRAFDKHRDGPYDGTRFCKEPEGEPKVGVCDADEPRQEDVTIHG